MSSYVNFNAFRDPPNEATLSSVRGLKGFSLFKHNTRPEWYLEDSAISDQITFFGPLRYAPAGDAEKRAKAGVRAFTDSIKRARLECWGLDELPTLTIYGNTGAGVDVGIICQNGEVTYARLNALPNGVLIFEDGAPRVEHPQSDEVDEDGEPVLDEFQFATEVANRFFSDSKRWRVTSDVEQPEDYTLLLRR